MSVFPAKPRVAVSCKNSGAVVQRGMGIGILQGDSVRSAIESGSLIKLEISELKKIALESFIVFDLRIRIAGQPRTSFSCFESANWLDPRTNSKGILSQYSKDSVDRRNYRSRSRRLEASIGLQIPLRKYCARR